MSYLKEFKVKVQEEKEATIERYIQFMEDFVLYEASLSQTGNVIVSREEIKKSFNEDAFISWLEQEGFTVTTLSTDNSLLVKFN